jgi:hypothetical protein
VKNAKWLVCCAFDERKTSMEIRSELVLCFAIGDRMHLPATHGLRATAAKRWVRLLAGIFSPREHLRVLPALTRPNLFAGD